MKLIKYNFLVTLTILLLNCNAYAQEETNFPSDYKVIDRGIIAIEYELKNLTDDEEYEIKLVCTRKSDPTFLLIPEKLTGDIGKLSSVFGRKKIIWEMTQEEINKLEKLKPRDFRFLVEPNELGGIPWYYFAGGATVCGIVAALILVKPPEAEATVEELKYAPFPGRP